jgi:hypothetical protein
MTKSILAFLALIPVLAAPAQLAAQPSETVQQIRQLIHSGNAYVAENLSDQPNTYSADGSMEFWSSGGLMQRVPADGDLLGYESYAMTSKYISVIELAEGQVAVAMYYTEGSYDVVGLDPVPNYLTRVTQVYVKENGEWKVRAAHYSPVAGGTGTNQTSVN